MMHLDTESRSAVMGPSWGWCGARGCPCWGGRVRGSVCGECSLGGGLPLPPIKEGAAHPPRTGDPGARRPLC